MKINIPKQIKYWKDGALSNIDTAKYLLDGGKLLEGLFFTHLSLEKILKAHVVKTTKDIPPYTHHLRRLAELAEIEFEKETVDFLGKMNNYQIGGRYPEDKVRPPTKAESLKLFKRSEELITCLTKKLKK